MEYRLLKNIVPNFLDGIVSSSALPLLTPFPSRVFINPGDFVILLLFTVL